MGVTFEARKTSILPKVQAKSGFPIPGNVALVVLVKDELIWEQRT